MRNVKVCCSALRRGVMVGTFCLMGALSTFAAKKPNVVVIYGDDVGFGDVGFGGSKMIPTPNIDKLARGGLIFTDGHCSSSVCSPSRYAMLTGQHPLRIGPECYLTLTSGWTTGHSNGYASHSLTCSRKRAITPPSLESGIWGSVPVGRQT